MSLYLDIFHCQIMFVIFGRTPFIKEEFHHLTGTARVSTYRTRRALPEPSHTAK